MAKIIAKQLNSSHTIDTTKLHGLKEEQELGRYGGTTDGARNLSHLLLRDALIRAMYVLNHVSSKTFPNMHYKICTG